MKYRSKNHGSISPLNPSTRAVASSFGSVVMMPPTSDRALSFGDELWSSWGLGRSMAIVGFALGRDETMMRRVSYVAEKLLSDRSCTANRSGWNTKEVMWSVGGMADNMEPLMMRTLAPPFMSAPPVRFRASRSVSANQISGAGKLARIRASAAVNPKEAAINATSISPWGGLDNSRYGAGMSENTDERAETKVGGVRRQSAEQSLPRPTSPLNICACDSDLDWDMTPIPSALTDR